MLHLPMSVPPPCPRLKFSSMATRGKLGQFDVNEPSSSAYSIEMPLVSFPDPPRPPTPGPPPRPPPIPPRPPVPTPPPSPRSETEAAWLQGLVAKQLSILAVHLIDIWFTQDGLVSLPYPDRPPTPGPRSVTVVPYYPLERAFALKHGLHSYVQLSLHLTEDYWNVRIGTNSALRTRPGPIGPRPDVPTPPPSPRRSATCSSCVKGGDDEYTEISNPNVSFSRQLAHPQLTFKQGMVLLHPLS